MASHLEHPDYRGIEILSPMVRGSALPMRLCCLQYGADLVYSGVTIDRLILETDRVENSATGCIDFVQRDEGRVVFSTCEQERRNVIFQLGSCDASLAAQAALRVCRDVRGVDINMGCTAPFSTSGGMGAKLLDKPDVVADMLKTLRRELPPECALSCKIRLFPSVARTRDFMQLCERSGVSAVAVHLRTAEDTKKEPAQWSQIAELCSAVRIPVIANGDFTSRSRISDFWAQFSEVDKESGPDDDCAAYSRRPSAVMIARGALWNPAVFSRWEDVAFDDVIHNYINTARRVDNIFYNTKWTLKEIFAPDDKKPAPIVYGGLQGRALRRLRQQIDNSSSTDDLCQLFDINRGCGRDPTPAAAAAAVGAGSEPPSALRAAAGAAEAAASAAVPVAVA